MGEGNTANVFALENEQSVFSKTIHSRKLFVLIIVLSLLAVLGYVLYRSILRGGEELAVPSVETFDQSIRKTATFPQGASVSDPIPLLTEANYQSESFRVGDIAIGGEAEFLLTEDTPAPLEISSIRGESFAEKNKQEVKLVLNWRTNKLAKSEVSYSKGVGQAKKTVSEEDYSLNHSMVIPGLDQASTYVYAITTNDRFGNEAMSDSHAVFTGSKTVSLFDLIAGAIGDVFGWAVKK